MKKQRIQFMQDEVGTVQVTSDSYLVCRNTAGWTGWDVNYKNKNPYHLNILYIYIFFSKFGTRINW